MSALFSIETKEAICMAADRIERLAASDATDSLFVGVDAVGPRTLAKIFDGNGTVVAVNHCVGPVNYQVFGEEVIKTIYGAIDNAIHLEGSILHSNQITGIVVAMPRFDDRSLQASFSKMLKERWLFGDVQVSVLPDLEIAMYAVAPSGSAIIVSSRERDRELGRNSAGENHRADGSGSGSTLALETIDAVIGAIKEEQEPTTLVPRFLDYFKVNRPVDLASEFDFFNEAERTQTLNEILSIVSDEAAYGDRVARELCSVTANRNAALTTATIRKLRIEHEAFPIGLLGDLWKIGDPIKRPYLSTVNDTAPSAFLADDTVDLAKSAALIGIELFSR